MADNDLNEANIERICEEIKARKEREGARITTTPAHRMMTGAELTEAHREKTAKQVACMVADILQERNWTYKQWQEAVAVSYTDNAPFQARMGLLTAHMDRYIAEGTQAASLEWRDGYCHLIPLTDAFVRDFRKRVLDEAGDVLRKRETRTY